MGWFQNRSVTTKMTLAFALLLAAVMVPGGYAQHVFAAIHAQTFATLNLLSTKMRLLNALDAAASEHYNLQLQHMLTLDQADMDAYEKQMARTLVTFKAAEDAYLPLLDEADERQLMAALQASQTVYFGFVAEVLKKSRTNDATMIHAAFMETRPLFAPVQTQIRDLMQRLAGDSATKMVLAEAEFVSAERLVTAAGLGALLLGLVLAMYMSRLLALPIRRLTRAVERLVTDGSLASGSFGEAVLVDVNAPTTTQDEVTQLGLSFGRLVSTLSSLAHHAQAIAAGELTRTIDHRGDLPQAFEQMKQRLAVLTEQLTLVGRAVTDEGRLDVEAHVPGATGAWLELTETVNRLAGGLARQVRIKSDLARFAQNLQGQKNLTASANLVLSDLAPLLGAQHGVFYLRDSDHADALKLHASYAYTERKHVANHFRLGEGLVGQCALERKRILVSEVPADYVKIQSGLGHHAPLHLVVVPIIFEDQVHGVLELASFGKFDDTQLGFLDQLANTIGVSLAALTAKLRTEQLLHASQELTAELQTQQEELQTQQEELRESNSRLESHTRALQSSDQVLRQQQEELQQTNEELQEKGTLLEAQRAKLEERTRALETAKLEVDEKARQLTLTSQYKSQFLANMSHELRTPLNSLLILSRMLADNMAGNLTPKQVEHAQTIHAAGGDLLGLINDVLDLAKIESGTVSIDADDVSLSDLRRTTEALFAPIAQSKDLEFSFVLDAALPATVCTDNRRLQQVVKNLLSNAFKFTERGAVRVRLGLTSTAPQLLELAVEDTGIGIAADKQGLVFEAFQQADAGTSRKYGGTGLGLAICREIARLLGGDLRLESHVGKGSTFTLTVPLTAAPRKAMRQAPQPLQMARTDTLRVEPEPTVQIDDDRQTVQPQDDVLLIIEDDVPFARILLDLARAKNFKALVATRAKDALTLLRQHRISAITLDLRLPDANGWALLDSIRRNPTTQHIPVHVVSVDADRTLGKRYGALTTLTKPVSKEALDGALTQIQQFLRRPTKHLLVVEDDARARGSIVELIGDSDIKITEAASGADALAALRAESFDCMVLDLRLPDMSGLELLRTLHGDLALRELPIIIYTGAKLTDEEETELSRLTDAVIIKDVRSPDRLLAETALFLHRVDTNLQPSRRTLLARSRVAESTLAGRKILVVDDDMRNIVVMTALLESYQVTVCYAESGKNALIELTRHADIQAVLMDIMMPEMDGYETMRQIRLNPQYKGLPIIALTAKAMKGDREKCLDAGASDYITKPVDQEQLISLLRVWCSSR